MNVRRHALASLLCFAFSAAFLAQLGCERKPGATEPSLEEQVRDAQVGILPEDAKPPNVIMILVDAMRPDRLGVYGGKQGLSPVMDKLAKEGVTFEFCMSAAPWTLPSVATLFTSYYPGVHKATSYRVVEDMEQGKQAVQSVLSEDFTTLAEVMKAGGYQTAGFVGAKFLRQGYGFGQGFDHYDTSFADNTVRGEEVNQSFFKWLDEERDADKPLFTYLHYMDVHGPYNAAPRFLDPLMEEVEKKEDKRLLEPAQFRRINRYLMAPPPDSSDPTRFERLKGYREYWEARYSAGVAEMDFYLGQLAENLKQRGIWDDAYIILIADHGEALCEHGLWGHGYSQHQTDLHVPLIMRWPGVLPADKRVRRLAGLIDVMPTLMDQLRLGGDAGDELQGVSLVDHIADRLPDKPLMRFAEAIKSGPRQYALYIDITKLTATYLPPQKQPDGAMSKPGVRHQLFNLVTDPSEMFDIAKQYSAQVKQMARLMGEVVRINMQTKPAEIIGPKPVDQQTISALESLGYAGGEDDEDYEDEEDEAGESPAPAPSSRPTGTTNTDAGDENP